MSEAKRYHLQAPADLTDILVQNRLGRELRAAGLERGDKFTYSQQINVETIQDAAGWAGLHILSDGPSEMVVVRRTPKIPRGGWAVNLNHLGGGWPTMGRIVAEVAGNWVKLRPYTIAGDPMDVVEPLDARWLARICTPAFPLDGLIWNRNGTARRIAEMGLVPWSRADEARMRTHDRGLQADDIEESRTIAAWVAADPLLCRAFQVTPERLLSKIGLLPDADAEESGGLNLGRRY